MQEPSSGTPAPKPFLRRGSGWEARVAATREGRRYLPRGGPVKDYSQEKEPPALARRRRAAAANKLKSVPCKPTSTSDSISGARRRAGSDAREPSRARPQHAAKPQAATKHPLQQPGTQERADAGNIWTRKLLSEAGLRGASTQPEQHPPDQAPHQADQDAALHEFAALEGQVLRAVGNAPLPHRPLPLGRKAHDAAAAGGNHANHAGDSNLGAREPGCLPSRGVDEGSAAPAGGAEEPLGSEGELEMEAESSFLRDAHTQLPHEQQRPPPSQLPRPAGAPARPPAQRLPLWPAAASAAVVAAGPGSEAEAVEQLQQEVVRLQEDRARVARLRMELEAAAAQLGRERAAFDKHKAEHAALFEAERREELRKLQRDRRVLEKQSRAVLKMPTKQCREEVAAVEALLAEERRTGRAREARHKLASDRLRQQLLDQQGTAAELREQVQCLEQQLLRQSWGLGPTASSGCGAGQPAEGPEAGLTSPAPSKQSASVLGGRPCPALGGQPAAAALEGPAQVPAPPVAVSARCAFQPARAPPARPCQEPGEEGTGPRGAAADAEPWAGGEGLADSGDPAAAEVPAEHSHGHGWGGPQAQEQESGRSEQDAADSAAAPAGSADAPSSPAQHGQTGPAALRRDLPVLSSCGQLSQPAAEQEGSTICQPDSNADPRLASPTSAAAPAASSASSLLAFHAATAPADSADDLRRLGRSLLAAGALPTRLTRQGQEEQPEQCGGSAAFPPVGGGGTEQEALIPVPVSEVLHADGRQERMFASGLRETRFANGSTRRALPGGATLTRFANGDLKQELPCGTVQYWYREVASWQVTHPSGVEVYHFPSGQVEAHHPGGSKEVLFRDGVARRVAPDGRELGIGAEQLSAEVQAAAPSVLL